MKNVGVCFTKPIDMDETKAILIHYGLRVIENPTWEDKLEFILAIGGDGAVLKAMPMAVEHDIPILGYHTGTLGFLTSGEVLDTLLNMWEFGDLVVKERLLLNVTAYLKGGYSGVDFPEHFKAMNEVAIVADNVGSLLVNKVEVSGKYVTTYKGDGLCISTPSGSTAWNLSAGGPILHPSVETIVLTPMNPFTLSTRPLVVNSDSVLEIEPAGQIIIDGRKIADDEQKCTKLIISKHDRYVKLLLHKDHDFYEAIRSKLGWNNNIKQ